MHYAFRFLTGFVLAAVIAVPLVSSAMSQYNDADTEQDIVTQIQTILEQIKKLQERLIVLEAKKRGQDSGDLRVCAKPPIQETCDENGQNCRMPALDSLSLAKTYENEAAAKAAGADILYRGPCKKMGKPVPSCRVITQYLRPESRGDEVKLLQERLTSEGFPVEQTGYFGPITAYAVKKFQEKHREEILTPAGTATTTGTVGEFTRRKLNKMCPTPLPIIVKPPITIDPTMAVCAQPPMPTCPEGKMCPQVMPVPTTYLNEEAAKNASATILYKGVCTINLVQ